MSRKLTLGQRIARLEHLVRCNKRAATVKNEAKLKRAIRRDLQSVFDNHLGSENYYDSEREFKENMLYLSQGSNDPAVDSAIMYMSSDYDYDEDLLDDLRDDIADALAEMADDLGLDYDDEDDDYDDSDDEDDDDDNPYYDPDDEDEDGHYNFHYWESRKRHARKSKSESRKVNPRRICNEAIKQLPNGMTANSVADVLSGFTGVGWSDSRGAVRKLERMGILDAAVNKWYPTVDDVAEAIEDCWDDSIGNGRGAAEFFIGNIGGETKCSLTLYPISGGNSRARKITLKFDWSE